MGDHPILFSAPMVRALIAGTKTQARRIIKPQGGSRVWQERAPIGDLVWKTDVRHTYGPTTMLFLREPGDRLWCREAWRTDAAFDHVAPRDLDVATPYRFEADGRWLDPYEMGDLSPGRLRSSMHMPRWASRLTLIVTDVRVQRLQDISEEDARAEGLEWVPPTYGVKGIAASWDPNPVFAYAALWQEINGADSWDANPWVAAYTFTVHRQNVDALPPASADEPASAPPPLAPHGAGHDR